MIAPGKKDAAAHFVLALALIVGIACCAVISGCSRACESGAICGDSNFIAPSTVVTTTTTTASPSPTPETLCVPQTAPFACTKGGPIFLTILEAEQAGLEAAPEPIYLEKLVAKLNKRPDVCAKVGPSPDEVTIKARVSNAISETWDVVKADGTIQAIPAAPANVCIPARF